MKKMKIGELAKAAGLNLQSLRYYEGLGLLDEPERTETGFRMYTEDYLEQLQFIKNTREMGLSLQEIKLLVQLKKDPKAKGKEIKDIVLKHVEEIDEKIKSMKRLKKELFSLTDACSGEMPARECPILKGLQQKNLKQKRRKVD